MELRLLLSNDPCCCLSSCHLIDFCQFWNWQLPPNPLSTLVLSIVPLGMNMLKCTGHENPATPFLMLCNKYKPVARASSPQWDLRLVFDTLVLNLYKLTDLSVNSCCLLLRGDHSGMTLTKPLLFPRTWEGYLNHDLSSWMLLSTSALDSSGVAILYWLSVSDCHLHQSHRWVDCNPPSAIYTHSKCGVAVAVFSGIPVLLEHTVISSVHQIMEKYR